VADLDRDDALARRQRQRATLRSTPCAAAPPIGVRFRSQSAAGISARIATNQSSDVIVCDIGAERSFRPGSGGACARSA
jgi:hypothetical protein